MRIALVGYGKMGKAIEEIAVRKGHQVTLKIDLYNTADLTASGLAKADVAIEFTGPESAFGNIMNCLSSGIPVVSGSTGWLDRKPEVEQYCRIHQGTMLYASNFSIGVNIFFEINKKLAELMAPHAEYEARIREIHHTEKKDAPSGTAITLAEQILDSSGQKKSWTNHPSEKPQELVITSERKDPAAGTHQVRYSSSIDDIEITHIAHNRMGFAAGALLAAEYIWNKTGVFTMKDVLAL